jgi:hypothetical protein
VSLARTLLLATAYGALVVGGLFAGTWLAELVTYDVRPVNEPQVHRMVLLAAGVYVAVAALPFVPGAEIGLALMLAMGRGIVPLVYASTVAALCLAYVLGRLVPARLTASALAAVGLRRARDLVLTLDGFDRDQRLRLLCERAPRRWVPFLLRHRYVLLGLLFNLPGNSLLGGGGGLAMAAGLSGVYSPLGFLLTTALAVAPVPLLFMATGALP